MPEPPIKEVKVNYSKKAAFWVTAGIIFLLSLCSYFAVPVFQILESSTIDKIRYPVRGARNPEAPVVIVAVDETSLKEVGQWPWPRALHAQLIRRLKQYGAKCVFYDVFFSEPERNQLKMLSQLEKTLNAVLPGSSKTTQTMKEKVLGNIRAFQETQNGDAEFATALKETHNVLLPIVPLTEREAGEEASSPEPETLHFTEAELFGGFGNEFPSTDYAIVSIPVLQSSALDAGNIRPIPEIDGIFRYFPTVVNYKGKLVPHLALQAARYLMDVKDPVKVHVGEYTEVGDRKIPILQNGLAMINFCGKVGTITTYSASDVLNGTLKPEQMEKLKGAAVLVGATAQGLYDLRPTPFTKAYPGVELNATIIENVFSHNFMTLAPDYLKYLLIILMALAVWYFIPRVTPIQGGLLFLLLFIGYVVLACVLFDEVHYVVNIVYPSLSLLLTYSFLTVYKFRTEVRHSRYMKQMFQSMVAPTVVEEILKLPAGIELGGEEKQLTVMFSDVRGFTSYSEKHTPREVVEVLNEYLTQMTHLIFQTEGTLDKYIGDAIMAFWGAPTTQADNAYRACSTALGMVDLLHNVLHPKWELEGKEKLQIGVGVNTGPMVVGFVGSESIKNYTLIGDAVNLGSRLEGTTKEYHVEVIISETTYQAVKNDMLCRELDLIKVKGKNEPIRIYELMDHRLKGASKEMKVRVFEEGLTHYRAQKWEEAVQCFKNCLGLDPKDGPAQVFLDRCGLLKKDPPGPQWDGVFVMKTK